MTPEDVDTVMDGTIEIEAGGRRVEVTAQQLEMAAEGMGRFQGVARRTILQETQEADGEELRVLLEVCGREALSLSFEAPDRMTMHQADVLRGMLDRAVKAAKVLLA